MQPYSPESLRKIHWYLSSEDSPIARYRDELWMREAAAVFDLLADGVPSSKIPWYSIRQNAKSQTWAEDDSAHVATQVWLLTDIWSEMLNENPSVEVFNSLFDNLQEDLEEAVEDE